MFTNISMAGVGYIITFLEGILVMFDIDIPNGSIAYGVNGIFAFIGLVLMVWGQLRRKDLTWGLFRK